jgi:hypothetical protein
MSYSLCDIKECVRHDNCKRFNIDAEKIQSYRFEFYKICNEENGYTYLIEKEKEKEVVNTETNAEKNA